MYGGGLDEMVALGLLVIAGAVGAVQVWILFWFVPWLWASVTPWLHYWAIT